MGSNSRLRASVFFAAAIRRARILPLKTPVSLLPGTVQACIPLPAGTALDGTEVRIDCGREKEITTKNNRAAVGR